MIFSSIARLFGPQWLRKSVGRPRYCQYFLQPIRNGHYGRGKPEPIKYAKKNERPTAKVWPNMTIRDLARAINTDPDFVFHLLLQTEYADVFNKYEDQIAHRDLIGRLINLAGFRSDFIPEPRSTIADVVVEDKDVYKKPPADPARCLPRPPVVTIMGHVDHGKTTLLDALRHSQIVTQEFGGITQHIGAFVVKLPHTGAKITFLDTPGHAAFKSMRARGARATDIVVLVVAADDGVMEQTVESLRFAREAGVALVVAINKVDKYNSDVKKTKGDLLAHNINLEEYGGDVQAICISALKGTNLVALQESIVALAEQMNLRADYKGLVEGAIIEAKTVHGKGGVCTVLVQRGTLKKGCCLVAGDVWCRVRAMYDEFGKVVAEAPPSMPVEVTGWRDGLPSAGDEVLELEDERRTKEVIAWRKKKAMEAKTEAARPEIERQRAEEREKYEASRKERLQLGYIKFNPTLPLPETKAIVEEQIPEFSVIIKGDVDGSVEAILEVYETYKSPGCKFEVVSFGIGPITENDLEMAELFKAKIYCFNISNPSTVEKLALERKLEVKHFNVIYKLVDDWKNELSNLLPLTDKEDIHGEGVVLQEFRVTEKGKKDKIPVAGCRVTKGVLSRKQRIRVLRGDEIIFDGVPLSMKKEKVVTNTANLGEEVGIAIEDASVHIMPNDIVRSYETFKVPQKTDWSPPGF